MTRSDALERRREGIGDRDEVVRQRRQPASPGRRDRSATRAISPAFVSRVSPTVSSRADAQQLGGQESPVGTASDMAGSVARGAFPVTGRAAMRCYHRR